jgi:hypothetical protein
MKRLATPTPASCTVLELAAPVGLEVAAASEAVLEPVPEAIREATVPKLSEVSSGRS